MRCSRRWTGERMALFQIAEPDAQPAATHAQARDRHRSGHDQLARRRRCATASPSCCPTTKAARWCRRSFATRMSVVEVGLRRDVAPVARSAEHDRLGQALHGARAGRRRRRPPIPLRFVEAPGMLQIATRSGVKSPVEISADDPAGAPRARRGAARRARSTAPWSPSPRTSTMRSARRRRTRRSLPASTCCACSTSRRPPRSPTASTTPPKASTPSTTWAAARSTSRSSSSRAACSRCSSTNGDSALGGDDFDHRVFCWAIEAGKLPPLVAAGCAPAARESRAKPRRCSPGTRRHRSSRSFRAATRSSLSSPAETFARDHADAGAEDDAAGAPRAARCGSRTGRTSRASSWSAARRGCRVCGGRSPSSSASRRSPTSIPTKSWPWARRCRRTRSPATATATTTGCCSTSSRCRSASRRWAA